jgi:eukaryotic-like serine/threonine-protein kinase
MEVKLEVFKGPDKGKVFVLNEHTTCIAGRGKDTGFRFSEDDPYISRRHFLLELAPPKVYFRDLDVTNPSKINGLYIEEAELCDGDIIEVGYTKLKASLKMDVAMKSIHCQRCGRTLEVYSDESSKQLCPKCETDAQAERPPRISMPTGPLKVLCSCGKDLTKQADSDGRARELMGRVSYSCKKCLPKKGADGGKKINGYEVIKKIGEGGMGKVYMVYHTPTARLLALKEMNIYNKHRGARFNREIRIMKKMLHGNVLSYVDSGQEKGSERPYLVMEYASSGGLDSLLMEKKGPLPPKTSVGFIVQALKGLEYIHKNGIVHRDIKPENILLQGKGQGQLIPKIADFGLAREFSKVGGSVLTKLGQAMGTILYMSPEQINDAHNVREPADLYSMGATLYQLLTGKYPFDFPTPVDILRFLAENRARAQSPEEALRLMMKAQNLNNPHMIVLSEDPIPVRKRNSSISPDLALIVDKAISKDISKRIQSAAEFRDRLDKLTWA